MINVVLKENKGMNFLPGKGKERPQHLRAKTHFRKV